jgi:hypothetical protein
MWSSIISFFLSPLLKWVTVTGLIGAAGIALFFLLPVGVALRTRVICLIVGLCALCGGSFFWYAFHAGEHHFAQRIAAKEAAAQALVGKAEAKLDACGALDWDPITGTCRPGWWK